MRDLGGGSSVLFAGDDEAPVGPRQPLDQRPLRVDRLCRSAPRVALPAGPHRLALARHVGETQCEQPLHGFDLVGGLGEEPVGAFAQRRTDLDDLAPVRCAKHAVAALAHALPQIGEEIGEQRQSSGLVLRRLHDVVDEILALEPDAEHPRRLAQHTL